ncbi:integrase, catalytic region, zinc finger, CCHC-type containing protein, partial [Tanacetum coccineum]
SEDLKKKILEIVLFAVGILLVRYLGVPLVTRRLNVKDCKRFVDKSEAGPIDEIVSRRQVYSDGFDNNATVAIKILILNKEKDDIIRWQSNEKNILKFSINKAWKDLSENFEKVAWYNVVWFSTMIPRHAFIVWLLMHGSELGSELTLLAGSELKTSELDTSELKTSEYRTDFASWQQRIRLYYRGKEDGVNILKSIDEGPFQIGTTRDTLAEGTKGA